MYQTIIHPKLLILLALSILMGCKNPTDDTSKPEQASNLTLIIDKCPDHSSYYDAAADTWTSTEDGIEISFIDENLTRQTYKTNNPPTRDTITFWTNSDNLLNVEHTFNALDHIDFLFQKGDTVLISYPNKFPIAQVLNRKTNSSNINYERTKCDLIIGNNPFSAITKFRQPLFRKLPFAEYKEIISDPLNRTQREIAILESDLEKVQSAFEEESRLLDSLLSAQRISRDYYDFYRQKSERELRFAKMEIQQLQSSLALNKEALDSTYFFPAPEQDSLVQFGYFNQMLERLENTQFYSQAPWVHQVNQRFPDYRVVYDSIANSKILSTLTKRKLLARNMQQIIEHFPKADIDTYFENFIVDVNSERLVKDLVEKYQDILPGTILGRFASGDQNTQQNFALSKLDLIDQNGQKTTFRDILSQHEGKIFYVDFWASSCLPCLLSMPYSHQLQNKFQPEGLQVVYISIDKKQGNWQKAAKKVQLNSADLSYLVDYNGDTHLLSQLKINEIPRYLLFKKDGELLQLRAFGPGTQEIQETLQNML